MIKFFRKIRQQLLNSGHMKKYSLYAIGEIVLVVLGILIALQINNWNENQQEQIKETELLQSLQSEFIYNLENIENAIKAWHDVQNNLKDFLKHSGPEYKPISKKEFANLLQGIQIQSLIYNPAVGVIDDILNSGQLNVFSNNNLRRKLATWKVLLTRVAYQEMVVETHRERIKEITLEQGNLTEQFIHSGAAEYFELDFGEYQFSNEGSQLLKNQPLTNVVLLKFASSTSLLKRYQEIKTEVEEILIILENELK